MPTPVIHRLVRDGQPLLRVNRRIRPDQPYRCSCGVRHTGTTSRRDALIVHGMHYAETLGGKP